MGSLGTTVKMNLVMIPLQIVISLCLALLVNSTIKGYWYFQEYLLFASYHGYFRSFYQLESDGKLQQRCI